MSENLDKLIDEWNDHHLTLDGDTAHILRSNMWGDSVLVTTYDGDRTKLFTIAEVERTIKVHQGRFTGGWLNEKDSRNMVLVTPEIIDDYDDNDDDLDTTQTVVISSGDKKLTIPEMVELLKKDVTFDGHKARLCIAFMSESRPLCKLIDREERKDYFVPSWEHAAHIVFDLKGVFTKSDIASEDDFSRNNFSDIKKIPIDDILKLAETVDVTLEGNPATISGLDARRGVIHANDSQVRVVRNWEHIHAILTKMDGKFHINHYAANRSSAENGFTFQYNSYPVNGSINGVISSHKESRERLSTFMVTALENDKFRTFKDAQKIYKKMLELEVLLEVVRANHSS